MSFVSGVQEQMVCPFTRNLFQSDSSIFESNKEMDGARIY
jgi:hypothetical protein